MDLTLRVVGDLSGVDPAQWNALQHAGSPFLEYGFLRALEESSSLGRASGWDPHYVLAERAGGVVGAVAAFVKDHSYGEYIFDFGWARASMRAGLSYYPKLVVAAPFTPATGPRILLHPDAPRDEVASALIDRVQELADEYECSSIHWLFTTEEERELLARVGYLPRSTFQFHWRNRGYETFDDFLATLSSRKRKQIRKERRRALAEVDGVEFLDGHDCCAADVKALDRFYRVTTYRHGGQDYLQPGFFEALRRHLPDRMRFARVQREGETIAGALYLESETTLYGRYWGCREEVEFLHFETAYYAGIERCIDRKLALFEAGAQGEHKLLRGFTPAPTFSAHWIRHPGLRDGVRRFLREESRSVAPYMQELERYSPYKRGET